MSFVIPGSDLPVISGFYPAPFFSESDDPEYRLRKMAFNYKKNRVWAESLHITTQLGLTMVGCVCFCFFIGLYLDRWLGTKGIFVTIFTILGVIGGGNVVYRQIIEITEEKSEKTKAKDREPDNGSA